MKPRRFIGLILLVSAVVPLSSSPSLTLPEDHVSGIWSDSCPCPVSCPCWKTKRASVRTCANVQVYFVTDGSYQAVDLRGRGFVILEFPSEPSIAPRPVAILLDEEARLQQNVALISVAERVVGSLKNVTISKHHIEWDIHNTEHRVTVPGLLSYDVLLSDPNKAAAPEVADYVYPWLYGLRQGMVRHVELTRLHNNVRYEHSNALFAYFDVDLSQ